MTLGEKIKLARLQSKMTQADLVKDKITRNMLSRIENGTVNPSLDTIKFLAERLSVPVSYLLSDDDDLLFYEKKDKIKSIYDAYSKKDFLFCVNKISEFSSIDDELAFLLASSYFELAKKSLLKGALQTAVKYIDLSLSNCEKTVLYTRNIEAVAPMYRAIAINVQAPLLEFDSKSYTDDLISVFDYDIFKYINYDNNHSYKDKCMDLHIKAKQFIKDRDYIRAVDILDEAVKIGFDEEYNAFVMFGIYADLEYCYKQLYDFEKAYQYSSKRLSMIEGFKS